MKVLTPWNTFNEYVNAAINVHSHGFNNADVENNYMTFLNPGLLITRQTILKTVQNATGLLGAFSKNFIYQAMTGR